MADRKPAIDAALWREADEVFAQLIELDDAARDAALRQLASSDTVRECAAKLLAAHRAEAGVLDSPPQVDVAPASDALAGRCVGRWRLEAEIGRGGMSVVYRARSTDDTVQLAAVKVLTLAAQAGAGGDAFRHERSVLARLRHPHIASLYDAGTTDDGTPWLAMALVDGTRIDAWCEQQHLTPREIVQRYLDVCSAVAYAHRNLVVHRDIKPSNVMVDAEGHVRLLDFGIARLLDRSSVDTLTQSRMLTPDYAAPEQFTGASPSTAMDVYGLGALLYRLLAGRAPRAGDDGVAAPSAVAPPAPRSQIRGDLDAIVLKTLATDPAQRYGTVAEFAEDLGRWLQGLPVLAQPPTLRYRLDRFVRRHRGQVLGVTLVTLGLLLALGISIWQAQRARLAADDARRQAQRAALQLQRADALRDFMTRLFVATDPERPTERITTTAQLLQVGARLAGQLGERDALLRGDIETTIGMIFVLQGDTASAQPLLDDAIARIRPAGDAATVELARALMWRGLVPDTSRPDMADESRFAEADALLRAHAPSSPLRIDVRRNWAWAKTQNRHFEESLPLLEPVLDGSWQGPAPTLDQRSKLLNSLGSTYAMLGRFADAQRAYDDALVMHGQLGTVGTRNHAVALVNSVQPDLRLGTFERADAKLTEAIAIYEALGPEAAQYRASAYIRLGMLRQAQGRFGAAREAYDRGNGEWANLRQLPLEQYSYTHRARGLLAANALRHAEAVHELQQFFDLAKAQGRDISGDRALAMAMLAGSACAGGDADRGDAALADARAAAGTSYDAAVIDQFLAESTLRCALARELDDAVARALAALERVDAALLPGDASDFARHALLRADALRRLLRADGIEPLARDALQRLAAVGLDDHPLAAMLRAL